MAFLRWPSKDPGATLDYSVDWSRWLAPADTIISSTWFVPSGINVTVSTNTTTMTTVFLSGPGSGPLADIQNQIVTSQGRTCVVTVTLPIGSSST